MCALSSFVPVGWSRNLKEMFTTLLLYGATVMLITIDLRALFSNMGGPLTFSYPHKSNNLEAKWFPQDFAIIGQVWECYHLIINYNII